MKRRGYTVMKWKKRSGANGEEKAAADWLIEL